MSLPHSKKPSHFEENAVDDVSLWVSHLVIFILSTKDKDGISS